MTSTNTVRFRIRGLHCTEDVGLVRREVEPLVGAERLSFDVLNEKMTLSVVPDGTSVESILEAVARAGMRAEPWTEGPAKASDEDRADRRIRAATTVASGLLTATAFAVHAGIAGGFAAALGSEGMGVAHGVPVAPLVLYALAIVSAVWQVLPRAWRALRSIRPDMNLLMTLAVAGAVVIGEWLEAATVSFLFALSLALESWSVDRARRAVAALLDLAPPTARVRTENGIERDVPPGEASVGTVFVVRPGERIPLDGRVVCGSSGVNQAPITGQSVPVAKEPGKEVYAGTINGDGVLEVEPAGDTTLAHIIRLVAEAQSQRAPAEQWVEKFARIYTPAVLGLAILVFLAPPLFFGAAWSAWGYRALVLLVIGCPCALVISTPVSIVAALTASARAGILVKGGGYLETAGQLQAIALDKTGTLTRGRPAVVEVVLLGGHEETDLLKRVGGMEARSDHPLARAILDYVKKKGVDIRPVDDFKIVQGKGATALVGGRRTWLGSHRYLEEWGQETPDVHDRLEAMAGAGRSVVVVGDDSHVCGLIGIADEIRPEARRVVEELRAVGLEHVVMLTGDNRGTADAVARETGVTEVRAELLPQDKVTAIEELAARYGRVAMVGDGVNDAPALARASLGIAMGAAGSDAAIESADVALMSDELEKLPWLIRHSRRTMATIRWNIALSLSVKGIFVVLTFLGFASLWAAITADMGASLAVIFNGMRLLRRKDESLRSVRR